MDYILRNDHDFHQGSFSGEVFQYLQTSPGFNSRVHTSVFGPLENHTRDTADLKCFRQEVVPNEDETIFYS